MLKIKIPTFKILLTSFLCFIQLNHVHALTIEELGDRSTKTNGVFVYVATNGNDNNSGDSDSPLATISAAIKKTYAYGIATINVRQGVYSSSSANSVGGRVLISGHPRVLIRKDPNTSGTVTFNAGFRILNGSTVIFRQIDFRQQGNMGGLQQIFVDNSTVYIDDFRATFVAGDKGFLRLLNSQGSLRVQTLDRNSYVNYRGYNKTGPIVEADYGSYLWIGGRRGTNTTPPRRVEILTSNTSTSGIYITGSKIYASSLRIQGTGRNGTGLLLNRGSQGRILSPDGEQQTLFYQLNNGIYSQNGSSVYLSGPIRVYRNNRGLRVDGGADIKYSDDVRIDSNTTNMSTPAVPSNILRDY